MVRHIPNMLTILNLLTGCIGIMLAQEEDYLNAFHCVLLAGLFDLMDGASARLLKVSSEIGKELDSLADVVSFGVLPEIIQTYSSNQILPFLAFLIAASSAMRLAKFNVGQAQEDRFLGLNTPTNTLLIASLPFVLMNYASIEKSTVSIFLVGIVVVCSLLLVSSIPFLNLKFKNFRLKDNLGRYILIFISIALIIAFRYQAFPLIVTSYIVLSFIFEVWLKSPSEQKI